MARSNTTWKKKQSGNPKGRPKSEYTWTELFQQALAEQITNNKGITKSKKEWCVDTLVKLFIKGNIMAAREIMDRMEGKAKQSTEVSTPEGKPLEIKVVYERNWQDAENPNLAFTPARTVTTSDNGS